MVLISIKVYKYQIKYLTTQTKSQKIESNIYPIFTRTYPNSKITYYTTG